MLHFPNPPPNLLKPNSILFGSGPTKKFPHWEWMHLREALLSRSHRSALGSAKLQRVIDLTRQVLEIPDSYQIAIIAGSASGAMETALWSFLGNRPVDVFAWDVFGKFWVKDVVEQLKVANRRIFEVDFGKLPDLYQYNPSHDVVFTGNGTSAGVCVANLEWIPDNRQGLSICDATSSAFALPLEWKKLDVTAFSWQKGLGSEAAHGMLVLSPRALDHLKEFIPPWPLPRLFRLADKGQINEDIFKGKTLNTPSMLCVEDCLQALQWAQSIGGQKALTTRTMENFQILEKWIDTHPHLDWIAQEKVYTSPTSVCFTLKEMACPKEIRTEVITQICQKLADLNVAFDIKNHLYAPASFRIWCGPTIEKEDLERLIPWINWALQATLLK